MQDLATTSGEGGHRTTFTIRSDGLAPAIDLLQRAGLRALTAAPPSLDDLFLSAYTAAADGDRGERS